MKIKKMLLAITCLTSGLCYAGHPHKTAGEKLDDTIDSVKEKARETKETFKEKYDNAVDAAKEKAQEAKDNSDEVREAIADKISPA